MYSNYYFLSRLPGPNQKEITLTDQTLELGPCYEIQVRQDACGCTLSFSFAHFEHGLKRTIASDGHVEVSYRSRADTVVARLKADLPEGQPSQKLETKTIETHFVPVEDLHIWLAGRLTQHRSRAFTEAEISTPICREQLERYAEDCADKICQYIDDVVMGRSRLSDVNSMLADILERNGPGGPDRRMPGFWFVDGVGPIIMA